MLFSKSTSVFISRRRWLKRILKNYLPELTSYRLFNEFDFYFDPKDMSGPSFHLAYDLEKGFQNYEKKSKDELLNIIPVDGTLYDIGANIGMFTVYIAMKREDVSIIGFEPEELAYKCLSLTLNSLGRKNISVFNKGVGSSFEDKKLYKSSINDGGHSFHEDHSKNELNGEIRDFKIASIINLDEFVQSKNLSMPDAIKIDVEGFELEVLKGSINTIRQNRPAMLIECSNTDLSSKGSLWQFFSILEEDGLFMREVGRDDKISLDELSLVAKRELQNGHKLSNYFFQFKK